MLLRAGVLIALCLAVVVATTASATPGTTPGTKEHVRGKVTRHWDRQLHTGTDTLPARLPDRSLRQSRLRGPLARPPLRRPTAHFVEYKGTDACYAPRVRVRCFRRHEAPVATEP